MSKHSTLAFDYLTRLLHLGPVMGVSPFPLKHLPRFVGAQYECTTGSIDGRKLILVEQNGESTLSAASLARHLEIICGKEDAICALVLPGVSQVGMSKLVQHRVPFIVPGHHLHIPALAISLSDVFAAVKKAPRLGRAPGTLGPVAQMLVIHEALRKDHKPETPSQIAAHFGLRGPTIANAARELMELGLVTRATSGSTRPLVYSVRGRSLFEAALSRLDQPVVSRHHFIGKSDLRWCLRSGGTALGELTMLAGTKVPVFASSIRMFRGLGDKNGLTECDEADAEVAVEVWRYDPRSLSDGPCVDPLSLYLTCRGDPDERVSIAADELLDQAFGSR